ncbi:MAG: RNA polymerase sigma factor [Pricia sp.]
MTSDSENHSNLKSFFKEEYHSLKAYARSRIDDTADRDAEDIVQEVALKVFSRSGTASPITNIAGFVYRAIQNKIVDLMRTKKEMTNVEDEMENRLIEFAELFYGTTDDFYSEDLKQALIKAIENLKPQYRNIIMAVDFEGYTYREIALETGIPQGTLMSRRHRALSILLKQLEGVKK